MVVYLHVIQHQAVLSGNCRWCFAIAHFFRIGPFSALYIPALQELPKRAANTGGICTGQVLPKKGA